MSPAERSPAPFDPQIPDSRTPILAAQPLAIMTDDAARRAALAAEERRMRQLRLLVDLSAAVLRTRPLTRAEAEMVVDTLRRQVLALFPEKEETFDLIYAPRFRRLIAERFDRPA